MDLLASSGSSVPAAAVRKAVGTWAARRQFGVRIVADLLCFWVGVGSGGRIRRCHRQECACMCVVVDGHQGRRERRDKGDRKSVQTHRILGSWC